MSSFIFHRIKWCIFLLSLLFTCCLVVNARPTNIAFYTADISGSRAAEKQIAQATPPVGSAVVNTFPVNNAGFAAQKSVFWQGGRRHIKVISLMMLAIVVISMLWIISLRRQVNQRIRMQQRLKEQLSCMSNMMFSVPWPVAVRNLRGELVSCNSRYLEEMNVTREEVYGKTVDVLPLPDFMIREFHRDYQRVITTGVPHMRDRLLMFNHSAQSRTVFYWIIPFHGSDGRNNGVLSGWIDMTERQEFIQQLNEARDEAVAANRAKTNFLSVMSHEIRTPLNAILGILELQIKQNVLAQQSQPMLEVAHDAAKNLLAVVGDILDISRIESGRMAIAPRKEELIALTRSVALLFKEATDQKQLTINMHVEGGDRCLLKIDPHRYKQILSNLLSNAVKFTRKGSIEVILKHEPAVEGMIAVSLTVKDSGIGITPEDQKRLFKPFTQLGSDKDASRLGSGLGLFICRTLCELMKGELTLESTPGVGTAVHVRLCLPAVAINPAELVSIAPVRRSSSGVKRVLIVDDYPPNLMLLRHQLEFLGHQVSEATNGEEALTLWLMTRNYDYILIDCNMPVMDGFTLAKLIRAEELRSAETRATLLGFTAIAQAEVVEQCIAAGMDGCLFKPCSQEVINKWIK